MYLPIGTLTTKYVALVVAQKSKSCHTIKHGLRTFLEEESIPWGVKFVAFVRMSIAK